MLSKGNFSNNKTLASFGRSPVDQVLENLKQALRVLELVPTSSTELTPHPLIVVRAEIETARRYLSQVRFYETQPAFKNQHIALREVA